MYTRHQYFFVQYSVCLVLFLSLFLLFPSLSLSGGVLSFIPFQFAPSVCDSSRRNCRYIKPSEPLSSLARSGAAIRPETRDFPVSKVYCCRLFPGNTGSRRCDARRTHAVLVSRSPMLASGLMTLFSYKISGKKKSILQNRIFIFTLLLKLYSFFISSQNIDVH